MIEVNTQDLIGPALDWAVAKAIGTKIDDSRGKELRIDVDAGLQSPWMPSVNWHQGGALIDKLGIDVLWVDKMVYAKISGRTNSDGAGESALVAVCRSVIAGKIGHAVSVPRELMQ